MSGEQVRQVMGVSLGGDPEFFFERGGEVIGAEKVLKEEGKEIVSTRFGHQKGEDVGADGKILKTFSAFVLDGVQVELNPRPHGCRTALGMELSAAFVSLRKHLEKMEGEKVQASIRTTIELGKEELDSLSEKAKVFGCAPSLNLYDSAARIEVDAATYLKRSAGGHIHLGLYPEHNPDLFKARESIVPILDTLLALPSVLIDRDPGNVERRLHYGRAGEYRLPPHGLEYRTLSNFWLRAFPLTSFVMGQARLAVNVLAADIKTKWNPDPWECSSSLLKEVDLKEVGEAINSNDLALAKQCWKPVEGWLREHTASWSGGGLTSSNLSSFSTFAEKVQEKGIEAFFPEDPLTHWCNLNTYLTDSKGGWESFLLNKV